MVSKLSLIAVLAIGCSSIGDGDLEINESDQGVTGSYDGVEFSSTSPEANVTEVVLEFNGLTVIHTFDHKAGVLLFDGFATANGEQTQMSDEDRATMAEFSAVVDSLGNQKEVSRAINMIQRSASILTQFPGSLDLRRFVMAEKDRSWTSICHLRRKYVPATHDGWDTSGDCPWYGCRRWDDNSTLDGGAWVDNNAGGSCSDGTYFWSNNAWVCYEPDHSSSIEYGYGECFGNCGGGCQGSGTEFTYDCLDHDQCVRFGHSIAALSCDDDFVSTLDDEASAPEC